MDVFSGDLCPEKAEPVRCTAIGSLLGLLDKLPALLWATDLRPDFTSLTGSGLQSAGLYARDFTGQPIESLFSGHAVAAHQTALGGLEASFDFEVNGREMEAHVQPLRGPQGELVGVLGVALDATDRIFAQRALRLSEQSYRSLIEEAPYSICRATESGQLLQVNHAMQEMLGYDPESGADLLETDLPVIFATADGFDSFRQALFTGSSVQSLETAWLRRDGQEIQVRLGARARRDTEGQILYVDLLAENVTEKKELEARLNQAHKMQAIGQLAGGVAHDFNNLLTVISGHVELALGNQLDNDLRRGLEDVRKAAKRAAELTRQLLAFSRRQLLQTKVLDVNLLIEQLSRMLGRLIRENVDLQFVPGCEGAFVEADPNQIEQVLMNLAVNAQDAMPNGGILKISTCTSRLDSATAAEVGALEGGEFVLISVRDTGHGMDRDTQARIFEPFFTTKQTRGNTGLGLSMAYGVVRQSGGYIQVQSQPGAGTTFRIYLPRVTGPVAVWNEAIIQSSPRGRETILLAEDEDSVQKLVSAYLRGLGYNVLAAGDGIAALQIVRSYSGPIDLLLSDLVLPKLGGRDLADELRKRVAHLKVIFISGYAGHGVEGKDLELPGAYFLPKPFEMHRLAATVRDVLDGKRT